jgi:hypothetical protein
MLLTLLLPLYHFVVDPFCIYENDALEQGHRRRSKALDDSNQLHLAYQNHGCCGTSDHELKKV